MRTPKRTALGTAAAAVLVLTLVLTLAPAPTLGSPSAPPGPSRAGGLTWQRVDLPHSHQSLRGLDAVDARTAWVSGDNGGVWRTTDAGKTWKDVRPDAEK